MTPIDMTVKHDPDNGTWGDCFRCCIASLLDLPAIEVPHLMGEGYKDGLTMQRELNAFLRDFNLCYYGMQLQADDPWPWPQWLEVDWNPYYVWSGRSPIADHSVIARGGVMVHDPSPRKQGLVGPFADNTWGYGFLVYGSK